MAVSQDMKARPPLKDISRSRREREKEQRRRAIAAAARKLFYENGYQTTTMEQIAAAAEVSKGTVYLYFSSKDELYVSIVLEGFEIINGKLAEISGSGEELFERGRGMFMAFVDFCLEHREYFLITQYLLSETARRNLPANLIDGLSRYTSGLLEYVAELVREGKEAGLIRQDVDPFAFSVIAWRTATGLLDLAVVNDEAGRAGGEYRELFENAYRLLFAGALRDGA